MPPHGRLACGPHRLGHARGEPDRPPQAPIWLRRYGDPQWLPGYCVLLSDDPTVDRVSALPQGKQTEYLQSMALLGSAVERACGEHDEAFLRVNLEILGNADAFLHAHVWPRYGWEPANIVKRPVWLYPVERWADAGTALGPQHDDLRALITAYLDEG